MKTDLELQKDVMEELKWESYIKASEIGVSVSSGVVTLSGYVDSYTKKRLAEKAALRVAGVRAVAEDIIVKFDSDNKKSDTEIAKAVLDAIKWHSVVPDDKIKVKVENGWVTVEGEVDWTFERDSVRLTIENLVGVRGISNLVTIKPKSKIDAQDIKDKINSAFKRSANIDANNVIVESIGNKVILRGTVHSYAEKMDAENSAWNAPGVTSIDNRLEVKVPVSVFN